MALQFLYDGYFAGKVGIGTESPIGKLDIKVDTANVLSFRDADSWSGYAGAAGIISSNANSSGIQPLEFYASGYNFKGGNVGIGTTLPGAKLQIQQSADNIGIRVFGFDDRSSEYVSMHDNGSSGTFAATGNIKLQSGGSGYAFIDSASDVYLDVGASSNDFKFRATGVGEIVTIKGSGNVGIGTTSPTTPLSIESSGSDDFIKITNTATYTGLWMNDSGTNNGWLVLSGYTDAVSSGDFAIREYGVQTSLTIKQTTGNVGIGTTSPFSTAKLQVKTATDKNLAIQTGTTNTTGIKINAFNDAGSANIPLELNGSILSLKTGETEKMRITSAGNVGIGTTLPAKKLHVLNSTNEAQIRLGQSGSGSYDIGVYSGDKFSIGRDADTQEFTLSNGNVGVGTTSPTAKLHVAGTGLFTGLVSGITPVAAANFVTKAYVDGSGGGTGPFLPLAGGTMTGVAGVVFPDAFKLNLGTGSDLQISHDGFDSYINNINSSLNIRNSQNDGDIYFQSDNGSGGIATYFYLDGSLVNGTSIKGATRFPDSSKIYMGDSADLEIFHDGSNSYIKETGSGNLWIQGSTQVNIGGANGEIGVQYVENAGVGLRHNNVTKLGTSSTGVTVTGAATATTFLGDLNGTINTATTGVTQANAINNTTIATTAYVTNKIGEIPAGLAFEGTWDARTVAEGGAGTPPSASPLNGQFWIVSIDGSQNLSGITDWKVGDWAIYVDNGAGTDGWQKVDNSSVLDGIGTGQTLPLWAGSGTSNTLTDSPITVSGNNVLVSAGLQLIRTSDPFIQFYEGSTNVGDVFADTSLNNIVLRGASSHGVRIMSNSAADNSETGITLDTSYNVGIGTTSPVVALNVNGSSNTTSGLYIQNQNTAIVSVANEATWLGTGSSNNAVVAAYGSNSLLFGTNATEKMRIEADGTVLIGTTSSAYDTTQGYSLHAMSDLTSQSYISVARKGQTSGSAGLVVGLDTTNAYLLVRDNIPLILGTNNLSRVFIQPSGYVGINTSTPRSRLQVAGGIQMADDTDTASADKAGTMRYRTGTEYVEVTGTELITNGDFEDGGANWNGSQTSPATVTFSNGKMTIVSPNGESAYRQQSILTPTKTYRATVDVVVRSGNCKLQWGTGTGSTTSVISATGSYVFYKTIPATGADALFYCARNGACDVDFDNVSVMEVTAEDASYADMCMQTGASTYEWVNIVRNTY